MTTPGHNHKNNHKNEDHTPGIEGYFDNDPLDPWYSDDWPALAENERRSERSWTRFPRASILILSAIFVVIEFTGAFISIPAQVALEAVAALASINLAIYGYRTNKTAGVVMGALFTSRLITLTIPASGISPQTRMGFVGIATAAICYLATWVLRIDIRSGRFDEGFPLKTPFVSKDVTSALTILSGLPAGIIAWLALRPPRLPVTSFLGMSWLAWVIALGFVALNAIGEEMLYRRLLAAMTQHAGSSQTPWVSSVLYASVFFASHNMAMILLAGACGAFWAWSCERTGSLKPVVAAHAIASLLAFTVFAG